MTEEVTNIYNKISFFCPINPRTKSQSLFASLKDEDLYDFGIRSS